MSSEAARWRSSSDRELQRNPDVHLWPAAAAASRICQRPLCPSSIAPASYEASIHATSGYASAAACSCACALPHLYSPSPRECNTDLSMPLPSTRCVI